MRIFSIDGLMINLDSICNIQPIGQHACLIVLNRGYMEADFEEEANYKSFTSALEELLQKKLPTNWFGQFMYNKANNKVRNLLKGSCYRCLLT